MIFLDDPRHAPAISVYGFSDTFGAIDGIPLGLCATAYDCPNTGRVYVLLFGNSLYFGDSMTASLICPNQVRANGNRVEDTPTMFEPESQHGLTLRDYDTGTDLFIPFALDGVISYWPTRKPTQREMNSNDTFFYWATSDDTEWNPNSPLFARNEENAREQYHGSTTTLSSLSSVKQTQYTYTSPSICACSIEDDGLLSERLFASRGLSPPCDGDTIYEPELVANLTEVTRGFSKAISTVKSVFTHVEERFASFDIRRIGAFRTGDKKQNIAGLAKRWGIGLEAAARTLEVTTRKGLRNVTHPVQKRFKRQPYHRKRIAPGKWFSDTTFFKKPSIVNGFTCAQLTTNGKGFACFLPLKSKSHASDGLVHFINKVGIPETLVTDGSKEQGSELTWRTNWMTVVKKYHIEQTWIEPHSWWQNAAELEIGAVKRDIRRFTQKTKSPRRLWSFLGSYIVGNRARTASSIPSNQGRTPYETVMGYTPDISTYFVHSWYDFVYYLDQDKECKIARWLGPASDYGDGSCFWLLPISCNPIVRSTVWEIPEEDLRSDARIEEMKQFNKRIAEKIGDDFQDGSEASVVFEIFDEPIPEDTAEVANPEEAIPDTEYTPEEYDEYITAEVMIPIGDERMKGVVKRRTKDDDGLPVGRRHPNPILDSREYEVEMADGSVGCYTANIIADNIYAQCDEEGNMYTLMDEIIDHRKNEKAVNINDGWIYSKSGNRRRRVTTAGWELLVQFKDDTARWVRLADLKESFPIQTAEYAVNNGIADEPAFAWWAKDAIRRRDRMICKAKTRYWKRTHKYGIELPKSVDEALMIDRRTGTDFWRKAIEKEMKNVMVAFDFVEEDEREAGALNGYEKLNYHMVFDVKITLDRKARLVADGQHVDEQPKENTFSSVPSRDTIRIFFLVAALNECDILAADIQNAYLTAPLKEKYYVKCGVEFGNNKGKTARVVRALYGLPVAGATFRAYLGKQLRKLLYVPMKADPDLWMRPAVKPNGEQYYEYLLAYVDDLCGMSMNTKNMFKAIGDLFTLKPDSIKEPDMYLGADIGKKEIEGKQYWTMSSTNYTKKAIAEVERELKKADKRLPNTARTPLGSGYRPELDQTPELDSKRQNYYQGLIGVLRWICELGRLDLLVAVSLMSRYLAQAREGHLEQVFHIFAYLKRYTESKLVFDDQVANIDERRFARCDWSEYYPDAKEAIPDDAPDARGKPVTMFCFVDADHAGCKQTRRSHTGVLIYLNNAPVMWYSKRQNTVETSTYGSEIVALRIAIEMIQGLRYKLRMMGVPMDGACSVFCDNDSVVQNTTRPESPLKKKANSICYHKARESIAAGWVRICKEPGTTNVADLLTKLMPESKMNELVTMCMWRH